MKVEVNIEEVQRGSVKLAHAWDKDQGLVTRFQCDFKTQPLREARILNILRQGGPLSVAIVAGQAQFDLQLVDESRGEVKMISARGEWRPRDAFLVIRVEGKFDETASGVPACLAIVWREGADSDHELSAQFSGESPTEAAMRAATGLGLVPPDLEEPVDVIRCLAEAYTATPGLKELQLILEMGTFDVTAQMADDAAGGNDKSPKRRRRKKTETPPAPEAAETPAP